MPIAQRLAWVCLMWVACVVLGACVERAWALAACWVAAGAMLAAGMRRDIWMRGSDVPVALEIHADGELRIVRPDGGRDRVAVAGGSLFVGSGAMLVLIGPATWRLLLGAGNVKPDALAALQRLLRGLRT